MIATIIPALWAGLKCLLSSRYALEAMAEIDAQDSDSTPNA